MNKKAKRLQIASICFFLGACGFYVSAVIGFLRDRSMAVSYLALGSTFLCLGGANLHRMNQLIDEQKKDEQQD